MHSHTNIKSCVKMLKHHHLPMRNALVYLTKTFLRHLVNWRSHSLLLPWLATTSLRYKPTHLQICFCRACQTINSFTKLSKLHIPFQLLLGHEKLNPGIALIMRQLEIKWAFAIRIWVAIYTLNVIIVLFPWSN